MKKALNDQKKLIKINYKNIASSSEKTEECLDYIFSLLFEEVKINHYKNEKR